MKKVISLFLIISIVMGNLNSEVVEALSNYGDEVKSIYNILTRTNEETKVDSEEDKEVKKEVEGETTDNSENKDTGLEETADLENKEVDSSETTNLENKELDTASFLKQNASTYANNKPITVIHNGTETKVSELNQVFAGMQYNGNGIDVVKIRFDQNYTMSQYDVDCMRVGFRPDRVILTAQPNVTVTVPSDLELYMDNHTYQPSQYSAKVITFEHIKLEFTGEYSIFANGTWLHMGEGVEMVGNYYPKLYAGSKGSGDNINNDVRIFVQSGSYSQISIANTSGRVINGYGYIYFLGGYVKKIIRLDDNMHTRTMEVQVFGGTIDEVINKSKNISKRMTLSVGNKVTFKIIEGVNDLNVGTFYYRDNNFKDYVEIPGELVITERMDSIGTLGCYKNSILEIGEKVPTINADSFWSKQGCTIRVPGNRGKDDIPLVLGWGVSISDPIKLELSTDIKMEEFYLMKVLNNANASRDKYIIEEKEEFYLKEIEKESDSTNGYINYLKAKSKEKGPLIYDTSSGKFTYIDFYGKEQDAWWINDKISKKEIDLNNVLNYDDLAKAELYHVLSPSEITLKIKGNGSNRTLKFNNNRNSNRSFNILFEDLDVSDCEFSFQDIKSITITGHNSIKRSSSNNKTPLTYSFAGNNGDALKLTNENSSFVVYDEGSDNNRYTIRDNIVDNGILGNTSIVNISIEENTSSIKNFKLDPVDQTSRPKKFSTKNGYEELTLLLPGDDKDYLLKEENTQKSDIPYYYQSTNIDNDSNQNCGKIGTKFTLTRNSKKDYYKVNNKQRVYVVANNNTNNKDYYYLSDNVRDAIKNEVAHTHITHNVIFLGNYTITSDDVEAIKNHDKNTAGVIYKTKVDDWKYLLNVNEDIELKIDSNSSAFPITFDNIKFNYNSDDKWIYANGRQLTFGRDVEMNGSYYPSISSGQNVSQAGKNSVHNGRVTIDSGTYKYVTGDRYNTLQNATVIINGGTFKNEVSGVRDDSTNKHRINNATLTINNGIFESKVYGVSPGSIANGSLNMTINGGIFKQKVIGVAGTVNGNNDTLTINNGTFENYLFGISSDTTREKFTLKGLFNGDLFRNSARATLNGTLNMTIKDGVFRNQVHGAQSAANGVTVNLNILGGDFKHNVVGTQVGGSTLTMTVSGGRFAGEFVGQYSTSEAGKANSVTLDVSGGTFNVNFRGSDYSDKTVLNVSGGTFNGPLVGNRTLQRDSVKININGNITVPIVMHYDELIVGASNNNSVLTVTNKIEANNVQDDNLIIKNNSEVKLTGNDQSKVNKLTVEGNGNILTLDMNKSNAPLIVKSEYEASNQRLTLNPLGTKINDSKLIGFESRKADVNNFDFKDNNYYIREIDNGSGNVITLCEKMSPDKLKFKLDISSSNSPRLTYSINDVNYENVWWYTPSLTSQDIKFNQENLFKYKGMYLFKNNNTIANGNKVFELINNGSDKTISFDLGAGTNFDFKLNNSNLTNSRLDLKNLRNLILSGGNSISGKPSDNNPAFSYQISGSVETDNDSSNLIVYTNKNNEGIKAISQSGYGAKFIFEEVLSSETRLKLKEQNSNNEVQLVIPANSQKVSLLLPQSFASNTYNLIDNTNQSSKYYFGDIVDSTFGYDISIDNKGKTYNKVNNKPFIGISKNGKFESSGKSMSEVINSINQDTSKQSTDYTLTFMNDYELNSSDLSSWKSWSENVKSMILTTKYEPLNIKYILTIDGDLTLARVNYKTTFKDIKLKFKNSNPWIYANGQHLVMHSGIEIDSGNKLSISGGSDNTITSVPNAKIEVLQGDYKSIEGSKSSVSGDVSVTIGGTANVTDLIVGSKNNAQNKTVTINKDLTVSEITDFNNLTVGGTNKVTLSELNKLDKGSSTGNLNLKNGSKISFKSNAQTAKLNDINVTGNNNTLVVQANASNSAVPVELSGTIKGDKLNIELSKLNNNATATKTHLIKFSTQTNADVENKYSLPNGYYVRDEQVNGLWYAVLYPQTDFNLEYNFADNKLYQVDNNNKKSEAWWYTGRNNNVTLTSDQLYKYKGYDLVKNPNSNNDRYITLTGKGSDKEFALDNNLNHVNVILDNINLTNSRIEVKNIKTLKLKGVNTINSINETKNIFEYSFNSAGGNDKVLTENDQSYLKIFTKKDTNPFNGSYATGIDFKFFKEFTSDDEVRLVENTPGKTELNFTIPKDTGRLGVLFGSSNKNKTYNLYHGRSGTTGNSVYVSGNTQTSFKESFETSSNNTIAKYDYVRRANPVNSVSVDVPNQMNFRVDTQSSGLGGINPSNWDQYFTATDMTVENNSLVVKDLFIDENGNTHYFGQTNTDLNLGYLGVSPSNTIKNDIELISKNNLDTNITSSPSGVKLALKFLHGSDEVPIDETVTTTKPLKTWKIPSNSAETMKIVPDFDSNGHFFNVNMNSPAMLNSSHNFTFRFGLQTP